MENLYSYVFWYNHHTELWYAIPTLQYVDFFASREEANGVITSNKIETLIEIITKPVSIE